MNKLDELMDLLAADGLELTREQAEALALRVSGSVEAYVTYLFQRDAALEDSAKVEPPPGNPGKFGAAADYEVAPPVG